MRPQVIGITTDFIVHNNVPRVVAGRGYVDATLDAGLLAILLPPAEHLVDAYASMCDGFVFIGGDDPDMRAFGHANHQAAVLVDEHRQSFELALLRSLKERKPDAPVLGICLGMQYMALLEGGQLEQHMPDRFETAAEHWEHVHPVQWAASRAITEATEAIQVTSKHRQAVIDPGRLRVIGRATDSVIEAVEDPDRAFYVGVQWHPERAPSVAESPDPVLPAFFAAVRRGATEHAR